MQRFSSSDPPSAGDDRPTARRSGDQKLLLFAGIGGLALIAAPFLVLQATDPGAPAAPGQQPAAETRVSALPAGQAVLDGQGMLMVLETGPGNEVLRSPAPAPDGGRVGGWTNLHGTAHGEPVTVADAQGRMAAFTVGTDGALWWHPSAERFADPALTWQKLGGERLVGTPAAAQDGTGKLVVVARSSDGTLWRYTQTAPDTWTSGGALPVPATEDPAVVRDSRGRLQVFAVGPDHLLRVIAQDGPGADSWGGAQDLGGPLKSAPAVIVDKMGRLNVFALGPAGELRWNAETAPGAAHWRSWQDLGGKLTGRPVAVTDARNTLVVFALGEDGGVRQTYQTGSSPTGWYDFAGADGDFGGDFDELVGAVLDGDDRLVVYAIDRKGSMQYTHQTQPASGPWRLWTDELGGFFPRD